MRNAIAAAVVLLGVLGGCVETPYRTEVRDTGGGSIQVVTIPRTPEPTTPAPVPNGAPQNHTAPTLTEQQKIDQLEAQVKALSAENQRLKQAAPTTLPSPQ